MFTRPFAQASGKVIKVPYTPFCGVMGVAPPPGQQVGASPASEEEASCTHALPLPQWVLIGMSPSGCPHAA